jgi:hypothetical protein
MDASGWLSQAAAASKSDRLMPPNIFQIVVPAFAG